VIFVFYYLIDQLICFSVRETVKHVYGYWVALSRDSLPLCISVSCSWKGDNDNLSLLEQFEYKNVLVKIREIIVNILP